MTKIDLQPFCADDDDHRENLKSPFNIGSNSYATTGNFFIKTDLDLGFEALQSNHGKAEIKSLHRTIKIFEDACQGIEELNYKPMPSINDVIKKECPICSGSGLLQLIECVECAGEGDVDLSNDFNDYNAECQTCDGKGKVTGIGSGQPCDACHGEMKITDESASCHTLDGLRVNISFLKLFEPLPNLQYAFMRPYQLAVKFDGGYGVIMARSDSTNFHIDVR
jgi:DnaJ-class molecular chaperone